MSALKLLSPKQIKDWDEFTIQNEPIKSIDLMERAAIECVKFLTQLPVFQSDSQIKIFCDRGNNGGDGLAIARLLNGKDFEITVYIVSENPKSTEDFEINYQKLKFIESIKIVEIRSVEDFEISENDIVIDAILGSGLNKPLTGIIKETVDKINTSSAFTIAIDTPTGFYSDLESIISTCVKADITLTLQLPKLRMLFPESYAFTGEINVLDIGLIPEFNYQSESKYFYLTQEAIRHILKKRKKFDHKGIYGHALLIAGSYGKMGAAVLSTKACLRSGVGLLTVACPKIGYEIIQNAAPEAMAYVIEEHEKYISSIPKLENFKAIGVGPGIDKKPITKNALKNLLLQPNLHSMVIDADGLNLLAELISENPHLKIPENTIITPHVKEFDRLAGKSENAIERHFKQLAFAQKHNIFVILKGAYTSIATPSDDCYFNSTGNPGMATGGSGDVLTGLLTGLLAQGYSPFETCMMGVYLHGLAGDLAAQELGQNALIASDIIDNLGNAFQIIQK